jgi:orotate phosphoribosyltransferase
VDRMPKGTQMDMPLISATKMEIKLYEPSECPLCRQGLPLISPGSKKRQLLSAWHK